MELRDLFADVRFKYSNVSDMQICVFCNDNSIFFISASHKEDTHGNPVVYILSDIDENGLVHPSYYGDYNEIRNYISYNHGGINFKKSIARACKCIRLYKYSITEF